MKVHPRTMVVQEAQIEISNALFDVRKKHGLTPTEFLGILMEQASRTLKFCLRAERHPDDPDKPADCE